MELPLKNQEKIHVRGRVDRIGQLVTPESTYLDVIDYGSSHHKFNTTEAYYGLAMQMLTYLDMVLMDAAQLVGQEAKPADSLYLYIHNPTLSYEGKDDIKQQMLKKYQFDDLLMKDLDLLDCLDTSLQAKQSSLLFPIGESVKRQIKPSRHQEDKLAVEPELGVLLSHDRNKLVEAGDQIIDGEV